MYIWTPQSDLLFYTFRLCIILENQSKTNNCLRTETKQLQTLITNQINQIWKLCKRANLYKGKVKQINQILGKLYKRASPYTNQIIRANPYKNEINHLMWKRCKPLYKSDTSDTGETM